MADRPETALARWSRLKRSGAEPEPRISRDDQLPAAPDSSQETGIEPAEDKSEETPAEQDDTTAAPDLPDIASLNAESDFSAFLRAGVPEEIRRKALRVLWRSDPVLANLDGLNDYDEDFSVVHSIAEAVQSAYKVGKGYVRKEEGRATSEESLEEPEDSRIEISVAEEGADAGEEPGITDSRESKERAGTSGEEPDSEDGSDTKV